jgi:hypothetical protein
MLHYIVLLSSSVRYVLRPVYVELNMAKPSHLLERKVFLTEIAEQNEGIISSKCFFRVIRRMILEIIEEMGARAQCYAVCTVSNLVHIFSFLNPVIELLLALLAFNHKAGVLSSASVFLFRQQGNSVMR